MYIVYIPNSLILLGEDNYRTDVTKPDSNKIQISESALCGENPDDCRKLDEEMDNAASCDRRLENLDGSAMSELPAPEKLLAVSEGLTSKPHDLLVESTPDIEGLAGSNVADTGTKAMSGKKRSFTESTLTEHSLNSVESIGASRVKRTAESIPDDDDLLSSILGIKMRFLMNFYNAFIPSCFLIVDGTS